MNNIEFLQKKAADYLVNAKIISPKAKIYISESDAYFIVKKLVLSNPIYKIFCNGNSSLENLNFILDIHIGLLDDEDFIYGVAAFHCSGKEQ